jgi:hypothetical protein
MNIMHKSGRYTSITDFPNENQRVRQALINSDGLRNPSAMIDGERGTKFVVKFFLVERMGTEKDPSEIDEHTRRQYLWALSDQNPVAEVQNRGSFMQ